MFLEPDAKKRHSRGNRDNMSGFFSSQREIASPRDLRPTIKRKALPLHERSQSDNNRENQSRWLRAENTTVRLVKQTPSPSGTVRNTRENGEDDQDLDTGKENRQFDAKRDRDRSSKTSFYSQSTSVSEPWLHVSDDDPAANGQQNFRRSDASSLLSAIPIHVQYATRPGDEVGPRLVWQSWRAPSRLYSTGDSSISSTLFREGESSVFGASERETEFSDLSTLRGSPTPQEQEFQTRLKEEDLDAHQVRHSDVSVLESVQEASPERSTVRVVSPTSGSESSELALRSEPSQSSIIVRPQSSPQSASHSEPSPPLPRRSSRRSSSIPAPLNIRKGNTSLTPRKRRSQESIAASEATISQASSPIFVAYGPDSSPRPRSKSQPLAHSFSVESIQSRVQYPTVVRPETGRSVGASSSWSSLQPGSSTDTLGALPALQIPKKRLRHKPGHSSLNQAARATSASTMADEDIDTLPYPREHFSSHLSTIASESDRQSRTNSARLSHFSLGSGVLTGDDASSILPFSSPNRRRTSAHIESMVSEVSPVGEGASNEEEQEQAQELGDMTLGVFREESAKPQPLFQPWPRSQSTPRSEKNYDGPLPPLPPIPGNSDEHADKVPSLPSPRLRPKRSGYSLRRRSNSTPSRRISESDRGSHASSIFPLWAKHFYGQGAALMSASKISLSNPESRGRSQGHGHERNASQWTERSITSRLGTGYSELDPPESPTSSHFLPSIFRPRTRGRANTDGGSKRLQKNRSRGQRSRPSGDEMRPDSMAIFNDPLPESRAGDETLPSGQPKWGTLKDTSEPPHPRPLPRKYSKQRRWDEMTFPRPMTKDRLSDFHLTNSDPHLAPTTRSSYRMSMWRAPSFVESLDSLWRSRSNRQILLFALGFLLPPCWLLGAVLPIPRKPMSSAEYDAEKARLGEGQSEEDIQVAMMKHDAGDAERRGR